MNLLPSKKNAFISKKNIDEVKSAIDNNCHEYGKAYKYRTKPLIGKRENNVFNFRRAIDGRNSFLPIVSGSLKEKEKNTTEINIKLELDKGVQKIIFLFAFSDQYYHIN